MLIKDKFLQYLQIYYFKGIFNPLLKLIKHNYHNRHNKSMLTIIFLILLTHFGTSQFGSTLVHIGFKAYDDSKKLPRMSILGK